MPEAIDIIRKIVSDSSESKRERGEYVNKTTSEINDMVDQVEDMVNTTFNWYDSIKFCEIIIDRFEKRVLSE